MVVFNIGIQFNVRYAYIIREPTPAYISTNKLHDRTSLSEWSLTSMVNKTKKPSVLVIISSEPYSGTFQRQRCYAKITLFKQLLIKPK